MSVNVARIYEQTIRLGYSYCRFCLRSGSETTLVTAHNALKFARVLKLNIFDDKSCNNAACIICEAMATNALRFYEACVNAVSVRCVGTELKDMKDDDLVPMWLQEAIRGCNRHLKDYRRRTKLQQTEVLVVDSSGIEWPSQAVSNQPGCRINAPKMSITTQQPAQPQTMNIETVVLDDDDDDEPSTTQTKSTSTVKSTSEVKSTSVVKSSSAVKSTLTVKMPTLVPIEKLLESSQSNDIAAYLPNQMQVITKNNNEVNSFILHPIILGKNNNLTVPSLGGEIINGKLVYNATVLQNLPLVDCTGTPENVIEQIINTNLNIVPLDTNTTKQKFTQGSTEQSVASVEANDILEKYLENNNKRTSRENISDNAKKKREEYIVDLESVNNLLLNENSDDIPLAMISNVESKVGDSDNINDTPLAVISNVMGNSEGLGMISEVKSQAEPRAIEKPGKIDWEDKIPMDVISFMDATDPNEKEFILPDPTPVTLPSNDVKRKVNRRKPKGDVIDLC